MDTNHFPSCIYLFGFYVAFNTVQVISRQVVGRAEETGTYSSSGFCTGNCRLMASNYQVSHLRLCREGGRRECYHYATVAPSQAVLNLPQTSPNQMERSLKHSESSLPNYESCILGCVYLFLHLSMFMITSTEP